MAITVQTHSGNALVNVSPEYCPICNRSILAIDVGHAFLANDYLERILLCPRSACKRLFIARYRSTRMTPSGREYDLVEVLPREITVSEHSETIKAISPSFVGIYSEAEKAEMQGLKLICGPGYRKALEFLIKDYVVRGLKPLDDAKPDIKEAAEKKIEAIKTTPLGNVITAHVADGRVKEVAARAVWLGNDETHYLRKWEDKDLKDLRLLIRLTTHWIEVEEMTKQLLEDMPPGKK